MSLWFLVFLSVLQGVTELFPVSSLGHTLLVPALFGMHIDKHAPQLLPFLVALHLGTALALLWYFRERWIALIGGFFAQLGGRKNDDGHMMWALIIARSRPASSGCCSRSASSACSTTCGSLRSH